MESGDVGGGGVMERCVGEQKNLVFDTMVYEEPMKLLKNRRNV